MALPLYEKIRNKRQRKFEAEVLSLATTKPKNRFVAFINAPLTLWCLSAVVLGFGGVYYTTYKQCMLDATKVRDQYSLYAPELVNRQVSFAISLGRAKSIAQVNKLMRVIPVDAVEVKDKNLSQISRLKDEAAARIVFAPRNDSDLMEKAKKHPGYDRFSDLFEGRPSMELADRDMPALWKFTNELLPALIMEALQGIYLIVPSCGPTTIIPLIRGEEAPQIALAIPFVPFVNKLKELHPDAFTKRPATTP